MAHFDRIKNMNKNELLREIEEKNRNSERADQVKFTLIVRCTESIEASSKEMRESVDRNAKSSDNLSRKILYLTGILAFGTLVIAGMAILDIIYKCPN